jgi:hypothetical protein
MNRAYVFPEGVKLKPDNVGKAMAVNLTTSCSILMPARDERRLTCVAKSCLWPLTLAFEDAPGLGALHYFAHWPSRDPHPDCPYRAGHAPRKPKRGEPAAPPVVVGPDLLADVIEHQLRTRYGAQVRRRKADTLYVTRLRANVRVLTPGNAAEIAALKHPPLLVAAEGDLAKLPVDFPMPRPIAVVRLDLSHEQNDRFGLLDTLPPSPEWHHWPGCIEPLSALDLTPMAYAKRFRVRGRAPELLWIADSYKQAIAFVEATLHAPIPESVLKLRRALVKRLLADGAWLHRVFAAADGPSARLRDNVRSAFVLGVYPQERDLLTHIELRNLRTSSWRRRLEAGPLLVRCVCRSFFVEADLWEQVLALRAKLTDIETREAEEKKALEAARAVLAQIRRDLVQVTGATAPIDPRKIVREELARLPCRGRQKAT